MAMRCLEPLAGESNFGVMTDGEDGSRVADAQRCDADSARTARNKKTAKPPHTMEQIKTIITIAKLPMLSASLTLSDSR